MHLNSIRICFTIALFAGAYPAYADDIEQQTENQHIAVLAGSCAACHGTNGNALAGNKSLVGLNSQYIVTSLNDYKSGKKPATVMHRHAKGLTDDEINLLAQHFSRLKPKPASLPKHPVRTVDF